MAPGTSWPARRNAGAGAQIDGHPYDHTEDQHAESEGDLFRFDRDRRRSDTAKSSSGTEEEKREARRPPNSARPAGWTALDRQCFFAAGNAGRACTDAIRYLGPPGAGGPPARRGTVVTVAGPSGR